DYAQAAGHALDLIARLQAELPYLGSWRSRQERGLDAAFSALLNEAVALAGVLDAPTALTLASFPPGTTDLTERTQKLRRAYDDQFNDFSRRALQPGASLRWRDLDDLLRVPFIPAETRAVLLDRVRTLAPTTPLDDGTQSAASVETSAEK